MGGGLPIYPEMSEEMIDYVVGQIRAFFGRCVSASSDRRLPVLVAVATVAGPPDSSLKIERRELDVCCNCPPNLLARFNVLTI